MRYWLAILAATLAACGGDGSPSPPAQPVVSDTTPPVINLTGDNPQFIEAGEAYTELGATATDNVDGNLRASIVIDASTVDTTVPGDYTVTYDVSDSSGNAATTVTRTVTVQDTTPPAITLLGDDPQVIITGNPYTELGATAADSLDGDLTASIAIDAAAVNTAVAGDYSVSYDVSDTAGNAAATVTRTVRVQNPPLPAAPTVSLEGNIKQLIFSWDAVAGAEYYRLLENAYGHSGFTQVGDDIPAGTLTATREIAVHLFDWLEAQYLVEACNLGGCNSSSVITATDVMLDTIGYFKSSDPGTHDEFGYSVALSADGNTLVVGVRGEEDETFDCGDEPDCGPWVQDDAGAVFVFRRGDNGWYQEARIRESDQFIGNLFGADVELSADGNTMVVNAPGSWYGTSFMSPAVYVYQYDGSWQETALIRSPEPEHFDSFGSVWDLEECSGHSAIDLSADGTILAIGAGAKDALGEDSGKVFIFRYDGQQWTHTGSITASNGEAGDRFGAGVAMNADGTRLAVHAPCEDSAASGVNGTASDNSAKDSGALYIYDFDSTTWQETTYVKASNTGSGDHFGIPVLSADGNTLAAAATREGSAATGIDGDQLDDSAGGAGAVYVFRFDGKDWSQQAYLKASNTGEGNGFGGSLAVSRTGDVLAIGAIGEESSAVGIDGDQNSNDSRLSGAVYVFHYIDGAWSQAAYVKASNTDPRDEFGSCVALSADGRTMTVGAINEDSRSTGIDGDQFDDGVYTTENYGAVYLY